MTDKPPNGPEVLSEIKEAIMFALTEFACGEKSVTFYSRSGDLKITLYVDGRKEVTRLQ